MRNRQLMVNQSFPLLKLLSSETKGVRIRGAGLLDPWHGLMLLLMTYAFEH